MSSARSDPSSAGSVDLQQALHELQALFDKGDKNGVKQKLTAAKIHLAQTGLYFAPPNADHDDLLTARSILEIGVFSSLRAGDLKAYQLYNASLQPFYNNFTDILQPSPNRPVTIGLQLLYLLSEGQLTEFHSTLERLDPQELGDVFIKLPTDLERWLMEGSYNRVYKARDRVPREEFTFLLERLMAQVRSQIAATLESSYPSLPLKNAATLLFYKSGETSQLQDFGAQRGWHLTPSSQVFTFPNSTNPDIVAASGVEDDNTNNVFDPSAPKGVYRGGPMKYLVIPAFKLAQQLEAIV